MRFEQRRAVMRIGSGAPRRNRTADPIITNDVLYQLSYRGTARVLGERAQRRKRPSGRALRSWTMTRKAHCCCGACSIEVEGEPVLNALCHCANCKRRTGSAFGWSAYFADEQVTAKTGNFGLYEITGKPQRRWFCATCGTTLLWKAG